MNIGETLGLVFGSFRTNKLRTFLTLLGVIIGVTTVITVVSVVRGMNRYVLSTLTQSGSGTFRIDRFGVITSRDEFLAAIKRKDLTMDDMESVKKGCELCDQVGGFSLVPTFNNNAEISVTAGRESIKDPQIFGVTANYADIAHREVVNGRYLTDSEVAHSAGSAVLGWEVAHGLFPNLDPIGKTIIINGRKFFVVGVLKKYGNFLGQNQDTLVEIPFGAFQRIFGRHTPIFVIGKVNDTSLLQQAMDQSRVVLRARHHRRTGEDDGFQIMTTSTLVQLWQNFSAGAFAAMIGIASIALVVGGIVIMNIMLVSVVERTAEIGLRKALGARKKDIRRQFLFESVILAAWGGIIGILIGAFAAKMISTFSPMPSSLELGPVLMALGLASSVGLVSGMWPALKAAKLDPIVALRTE
jgi:putative ABC transport system permease protein